MESEYSFDVSTNKVMGVIQFISAKPFKFFVSSMTHVHKLEAHANCKFHGDKSFGSVGYFNAVIKVKVSLL